MYIYIFIFYVYTCLSTVIYGQLHKLHEANETTEVVRPSRPKQPTKHDGNSWRFQVTGEHTCISYIYTYRCRDLSQVHHPGKIDEKPGRKLNFWVDFLKFLWTSRCSRCTSSRFLAWISTHRMVDVTTEYWPQGQGAETDGWSGSGEFTIKLSLWYLQGGPGP